jgi:cytochrome c553
MAMAACSTNRAFAESPIARQSCEQQDLSLLAFPPQRASAVGGASGLLSAVRAFASVNNPPEWIALKALLVMGFSLLSGCSKQGSVEQSASSFSAVKPAKLGLCAGCHGDSGKAVLPQYPNLHGQNAQYLETSLKAYRSGERKSAEMRPMVGTLTDAEITEFANYFSQQKPQ